MGTVLGTSGVEDKFYYVVQRGEVVGAPQFLCQSIQGLQVADGRQVLVTIVLLLENTNTEILPATKMFVCPSRPRTRTV